MDSRSKVKDEFDITVVNYARDQATAADLELAQEEYARKRAEAMSRRGGAHTHTSRSGTSSIAERVNRAEELRQAKKRLTDPSISTAERNLLQKRLAEEEMAERFAQR